MSELAPLPTKTRSVMSRTCKRLSDEFGSLPSEIEGVLRSLRALHSQTYDELFAVVGLFLNERSEFRSVSSLEKFKNSYLQILKHYNRTTVPKGLKNFSKIVSWLNTNIWEEKYREQFAGILFATVVEWYDRWEASFSNRRAVNAAIDFEYWGQLIRINITRALPNLELGHSFAAAYMGWLVREMSWRRWWGIDKYMRSFLPIEGDFFLEFLNWHCLRDRGCALSPNERAFFQGLACSQQ